MTSPTTTTTTTNKTHILVFPYPAQGHLLPLLDLTHHLLTRSRHTLTATVLVTPDNLPILTPLLSSHPASSLTPLVLPFPSSGPQNTQNLPPNSFLQIMPSLRRLRLPLLRWFSSHPSPPSSIISDMFLGWTNLLASEMGIKRFVFSPSGSLALSIIGSVWNNLPPTPLDENDAVSFPNVPRRPEFRWYQLPVLFRAYSSGDPAAEFLRSEWLHNEASSGLVVNTYFDLEQPYLAHLASTLAHGSVWAVGPLMPYEPEGRGGSDPDEVLAWLDECREEEVVYVCFGTQAVLRNDQMEVLAGALERSGVRFVWKIKEPNEGHVGGDGFGRLPSGFEDRVAGRGLLVRGWVPQVSILRHPAVGAFLTHCGWNSVLEGLSAGKMMLAWPQDADQFFNSTLLVDWVKVGVRVGQGARSVPDPDELAQVLAGSLNGHYKEQRLKGVELKNEAAEAVSEGGSSLVELDTLVDHLSKLPRPDADVIRRCEIEAEEEEVADLG